MKKLIVFVVFILCVPAFGYAKENKEKMWVEYGDWLMVKLPGEEQTRWLYYNQILQKFYPQYASYASVGELPKKEYRYCPHCGEKL